MNILQEIDTYLKRIHQLQLDEEDKASDLTVTVQLNLLGNQGGNYGLRIHNNQINTGAGYAKAPDLTITMTAEDFLAVVKDEADTMGMVLSGRIKIEGDKMLAMRVASILGGK